MYHKKPINQQQPPQKWKTITFNRYSNCKINIYFLKKQQQTNKQSTHTYTQTTNIDLNSISLRSDKKPREDETNIRDEREKQTKASKVLVDVIA